ncbi:CoA-binding protein [Vibrio sp. DW001]|uniref:CoA-binding protein n=1 Tax=Vibrio sp. DW001 TaxID=2912315 RepID=UPI0023AE8978|nr:CoA-binding protein [Vibrio sp. DW001]WED28594.1 CoA-binding protein [Vibrio sp. DW001]
MITDTSEKIAILGISDKAERYSFKAYQKLLENGFTNLAGISPKKISLSQIELVDTLDGLSENVHTLTLYVGAQRLEPMIEPILSLSPKRIILNPGTENQNLMTQAAKRGIEVVEGCTLVMLATEQF